MILAIRIIGNVKKDMDILETLFRMRLRKKYTSVLITPTPENMKLLKRMRNFIAYGDVTKETMIKLIEKRGKLIGGSDKKIDATKVVENLEKKNLEAQGIKPYFRLHPPLKGIDCKVHFGTGKGVLGDNKDKINDLVRRML